MNQLTEMDGLYLLKNNILIFNLNSIIIYIIMSYVTAYWQGGLGNQIYIVFAIFTYAFKFNKMPIFFKYNDSEGRRPTYWSSLFKYLTTENVDTYDTYNWLNSKEECMPDVGDKNIRLTGYFQNVNIFNEYTEKINTILKIREQQNEIKTKYEELFTSVYSNSLYKKIVGIHFRIGDYRKGCEQNIKRFGNNHPGMPILSENYYKTCLDLITEDSYLFLFCEEENESEVNEIMTRINNKKLNYKFVRTNNEVSDLFLMSLCDEIVIANSSYSWWAAFWNNKNSKIYIPYKWFETYTTNEKYIKNSTLIHY